MAETDFSDLVNAVEQLASEVDETGELPRVERTPRQVLEASQELWARVTTTGTQEIQANLLLGSKGVDLPQLTQKLESLHTKSTFETAEAIPDTDIESFVRNEIQNGLIAGFEPSHIRSMEFHDEINEYFLMKDWLLKRTKESISTLGVDMKKKKFVHMPLVKENGISRKFAGICFLNPDEARYARALVEYNESILRGKKPSLVDKFSNAVLPNKDKNLNEMWAIVKCMTQIPPHVKMREAMAARQSIRLKLKIIAQARNFLENRYRLYMATVVQKSLKFSQYDKKRSTYALVRSFVGICVPRGYLGLDPVLIDGLPLWVLVYYCLRCGDLQAAFKCVKLAGPGFEEICKALAEMKSSIKRKISFRRERLIRTYYKRRVRNETDPYKRVVFCILSACNETEEHSEIIKTADDYLWLKLNQIHEVIVCSKNRVIHQYASLAQLQRLIFEKYGESHFNASQQPHVYFQMLFLTGQFEAAVDFLLRNERLYVHGVHVAIVLHEKCLLALAATTESPLFVKDPHDLKPMHRINFTRIIKPYVSKFENQHVVEALHYYFCLRTLYNALSGNNVFADCVIHLATTTREYELILGRLDSDNRIYGIIDYFVVRKNNVDAVMNGDQLIRKVKQKIPYKDNEKIFIFIAKANVLFLTRNTAIAFEEMCEYEDAIKLYDLAKDYESVLRLMSLMMRPLVTQVDNEPGSLRKRLDLYAQGVVKRLSKLKRRFHESLYSTFLHLFVLLKFFTFYNKKQFSQALKAIERSGLIPLSMDKVDEMVKNLYTMSEEVWYNIPDALLATMDILHKQYCKIKLESQNTSRSYSGESPREQLHSLKEKAKALTTFTSSIPHGLPREIGKKLIQLEIMMD